ncbi:hypothetical protein BDV28DRAFT_142083 [Aspergillus coremiiformis]|uniref:Uncharacterized protein n=1 Tax=Aspergillus coremiiformis TaxID=138285 RepID=A0A5N6YV89_9EURO|nr:hypothetical protein BDV28DRAFT_142083 [Aspergillus coremiiformis]
MTSSNLMPKLIQILNLFLVTYTRALMTIRPQYYTRTSFYYSYYYTLSCVGFCYLAYVGGAKRGILGR